MLQQENLVQVRPLMIGILVWEFKGSK